MATLAATADPTTGTVRIDIEQTTMRDLFTRAVANSWGNATTGQAYTNFGGVAANFNVNGTQGTHTLTTTNAARISTLTPQLASVDHVFYSQVTVPVLALTQPIQESVIARFSNVTNYYFAEVSLAPGTNIATLNLRKSVLGVWTTIASVVLDQVHAAGATWNIAISACGTLIQAKAWRSTVTEPGWLLSVNDWDLPSGTDVGNRSFLVTGNSNVSPIMAWDNSFAYVSQPFRLYRTTPDGATSEVRGSPGFTENATAAAASATSVFYDNEAPFDVDVSYTLASACNPAVLLTSNTVNLDSGGDGWLRDPVDAGLNLRIVMEEFFDECVDEDVIVFSGLDAREYANASGIFDIVDAHRPNTVSQTRKNYASALYLTSFSLDDVDALEDIFDAGRILLLSLPLSEQYGWATRTYGSDYITLSDVTQNLIGVDQRVTARVWSAPFRLSDEPPDPDPGGTGGNGAGVPGATFDDLAASVIGTTFNSLTASGFTFFQIAQGTGY